MMAIRSISQGCSYTHYIKAYNYTYQNLRTPNLSTTRKSEIPLEPCTAMHFSKIKNISDQFSHFQMSNWLCFPLNKRYEIGGSWDLSNTYKAIQIQATCNQSCGINNCGTLAVYQLNTVINPDNANPF